MIDITVDGKYAIFKITNKEEIFTFIVPDFEKFRKHLAKDSTQPYCKRSFSSNSVVCYLPNIRKLYVLTSSSSGGVSMSLNMKRKTWKKLVDSILLFSGG